MIHHVTVWYCWIGFSEDVRYCSKRPAQSQSARHRMTHRMAIWRRWSTHTGSTRREATGRRTAWRCPRQNIEIRVSLEFSSELTVDRSI